MRENFNNFPGGQSEQPKSSSAEKAQSASEALRLELKRELGRKVNKIVQNEKYATTTVKHESPKIITQSNETTETTNQPKGQSVGEHQSSYQPNGRSTEGYRRSYQPIDQEKRKRSFEFEDDRESMIRQMYEKAKKNDVFKKAVAGVLAVAASIAIVACGHGVIKQNHNLETASVAGEQINGVFYDYSHYADYENKDSKHAYDYSLADRYGDRDATVEGIMDVAKRMPEALSSYAYTILSSSEKQELGIDGMSMVEIDDTISNDENGGELQQRILDKLDQVLNDKDNTKLKFYRENGFEESSYITFEDDDNDGNMIPSEMHVRYATVKRNGAPQADVSRLYTMSNGEKAWVDVADLNMNCGGQVNFDSGNFPKGVQKIKETIPAKETTTTPESTTVEQEPTTETTTEQETTTETTTEQEPTTETPPTPTETETIKPKDSDNLIRIDQKINEDIAKDIGTEKIVIAPNPGVSNREITNKPSSGSYQGTRPNIVQNDSSKVAERIQDIISQVNDYSKDRGGANSGEYAPVKENPTAQAEADAKEIPISEAPTGGTELSDILSDLGIN